MGRSWRIGRLFGINICIDSSWVLIFFLVTWTLAAGFFPLSYPQWSMLQYWYMGIVTSLLFFGSVLIHELSHSLVARAQGERVQRITLHLFGGAAQIAEEPKTAASELTMSLAGPLASFALAAIFALLRVAFRGSAEQFEGMFRYLATINLGLAIFNLVPGFPLDGGRVLRSVVWMATNDLRLATRVASWVGQTVAFLMVVSGVLLLFTGNLLNGVWIMLIGWFLRNAAISSYRQILIRDAMAEVLASQLMHRDFISVPPEMSIQKLLDDYVIAYSQHAYPVTEDSTLIGIISPLDIRKVPRDLWSVTPVQQVMTPRAELHVVAPSDDGNTILARMAAKDVHQLPVVEGTHLVGMIARNDLVRYMQWQTELGMHA